MHIIDFDILILLPCILVLEEALGMLGGKKGAGRVRCGYTRDPGNAVQSRCPRGPDKSAGSPLAGRIDEGGADGTRGG